MDAGDIFFEVIEVDFAHHGRYLADFFVEFGEVAQLVLNIFNICQYSVEFIEARIDFGEFTAEISRNGPSQAVDEPVLFFVFTVNNLQGLLDFFEGGKEFCYFAFGHGVGRLGLLACLPQAGTMENNAICCDILLLITFSRKWI